MSITHTGSVGVNILNPPNQFTVAPELRIINGSINTITLVTYNIGLNISTITVSNNIFPSSIESQNLLIGGTCVIGNTTLTTATILSITGLNQFTVSGNFTSWSNNNTTIYIHYPGLNVSGQNGFIGINTTSMNSPLSVYGAISTSIITTSSNITLDATHYTVICNTTSNNIIITLPVNGSGITGRLYRIKNIGTGLNIVIVNGNGSNIDGSITYNIVYSGGVMGYNTFQSDGSNWWIVG
jgi:hypothetical protein